MSAPDRALQLAPKDIRKEVFLNTSRCEANGYRGALAAKFFPKEFWLEQERVVEGLAEKQEVKVIQISKDYETLENKMSFLQEEETREPDFPNVDFQEKINTIAKEYQERLIKKFNGEIDQQFMRLNVYYKNNLVFLETLKNIQKVMKEANYLDIKSPWAQSARLTTESSLSLTLFIIEKTETLEDFLIYKDCQAKIQSKLGG